MSVLIQFLNRIGNRLTTLNNLLTGDGDGVIYQTGSGNWTKPDDVWSIDFVLVGGGGGGGGSQSATSATAGGGGGAGIVIGVNVAVKVGNMAYVIGAGGAGGAAGVQGTAGGDSTFNGAFGAIAKGGEGGYPNNASNRYGGRGGYAHHGINIYRTGQMMYYIEGGEGGQGITSGVGNAGGIINDKIKVIENGIGLQPGLAGNRTASTAFTNGGGGGGASYSGRAGDGGDTDSNGVDAAGFGGGGGGAGLPSSNRTGGAGADGVLIIWYNKKTV